MGPSRVFACLAIALLAGCSSAPDDNTASAADAVVVAKSKTPVERPIMILDIEQSSKTVCVATCKAVDLGKPGPDGHYPESGDNDAFAKLVAACTPTGSVTIARAQKLLKDGFTADAENMADDSLWTTQSKSDDVYGDWLALVEGSTPCKSKLGDMLVTREVLADRVATLAAELAELKKTTDDLRKRAADEAEAKRFEEAQVRKRLEADQREAELEAAQRQRGVEMRAYARKYDSWWGVFGLD
jgi:regulator of replication initiation timing